MKYKKILCGVVAAATAAGMLTTTLYIESKQIAAAENSEFTPKYFSVVDENGNQYSYKTNSENSVTLTFIYVPDDKKASTTKIVIPSTVTDDDDGKVYTITTVGEGNTSHGPTTALAGWFENGLAVEIPDTVITINDYAFYNCDSIESVKIGNNVEYIGETAFYQCYGLTEIDIPDSVRTIGKGAFEKSGLKDIIIPCDIGESAFSQCYDLETVIIKEGARTIGKSAFEGCNNLSDVTLSNGVESLGSFAFRYCRNLENITIPKSVQTIGNCTFASTRLKSVIIPDGVKSIGSSAFNGCTNLSSVKISGSVISVGANAFYYCGNLTSVTIEEGVKSIGEEAFYECNNLTSIDIPGSVVLIGENAFYRCTSLSAVTIREGVRSIGTSAFKFCDSLTTIVIPDGVTSIGEDAFQSSSLTSITIPESVISIGDDAFTSLRTAQPKITYGGTKEQWEKLLDRSDWDGSIKYYNDDDGNDYKLSWEDSKYVEYILDEDDDDNDVWNPNPNSTNENTIEFTGTGESSDNTTPLNAPTNITANSGTNYITLGWDTVDDAIGYVVGYSADSGSSWVYKNTKTNSITINGLLPGKTYYFKIAATDGKTPGNFTQSFINSTNNDPDYSFDFETSNGSIKDGEVYDDVEEFYKVEHYKQNEARAVDGYTLEETENLIGKTGEEVTATTKEYEGMAVNQTKSTLSGKIAANGKLVLKVFYDYNPGDEAAYTVEHYKQKEKGSTDYEKQNDDTENLTGKIGETATAIPKNYAGMVVNDVKSNPTKSGTITADGNLVLKVFYDYTTTSTPSTPPTPTPPPTPSSEPESSEPESSEPESSEPESSNPESSEPESSEPESSEPETTEPEISVPDNPNPPTGITAFIVPIILASGAVVIVAMKRKK